MDNDAPSQDASLHAQAGETPGRVTVFDAPLCDIEGEVDALSDATTCCFRFVDCEAFLSKSVLRIFEYESLPAQKYGAVSHVWKGLPMLEGSTAKTFNITGTKKDASPVSIDVLRTACYASLAFQSQLLWLDLLCIMQGNREDKSWQIRRVFTIFQNCHVCLILPGGLSRLATLHDETTWIHRAWTLQESVAPDMSFCLFSWNLGPATSFRFSLGTIIELVRGETAMAHLIDLLNLSLISTGAELDLHEFPRDLSMIRDERFTSAPYMGMEMSKNPTRVYVDIRIFGHNRSLDEKMHYPLLVQALTATGDRRENALWRSSFLRTSSRAVDAVISIMGLFGVALDPDRYREGDRLRATIDLMREILRMGGRANWLTFSGRSRIAYEFCLAPRFPEVDEAGEAFYRRPADGREVTAATYFGLNWWWLRKLPRGSMDDGGYFTFRAPALPLPETVSAPSFGDLGSWGGSYAEPSQEEYRELDEICERKIHTHSCLTSGEEDAKSYAVWIGTKKPFAPSGMSLVSPRFLVVMLVRRRAAGEPFFNVGIEPVGEDFARHPDLTAREFTVGGFDPAAGNEVEISSDLGRMAMR